MIEVAQVREVVEGAIADSDLFVVSVKVSPGNIIDVSLDSLTGVTIEQCMAVDRAVHAAIDQDAEDYELTVGSYGLTSPFVVKQHYIKNLGKPVEVLTRDGKKLRGTLTEATETEMAVAVPTKVKVEGKKRPEVQDIEHRMAYGDVKTARAVIPGFE